MPPCTTHYQKNTTQSDQWHNPQPLPTKPTTHNHPTIASKLRTTTHNHCQKSKLVKNHHTNQQQHNHTTTDPQNPATIKSSEPATTKARETHEIQPHHQSHGQISLPRFYLDRSCNALEFDEGGAGGVSWEQCLGIVGDCVVGKMTWREGDWERDGAWVNDGAWVDNGAWVDGEMEN